MMSDCLSTDEVHPVFLALLFCSVLSIFLSCSPSLKSQNEKHRQYYNLWQGTLQKAVKYKINKW